MRRCFLFSLSLAVSFAAESAHINGKVTDASGKMPSMRKYKPADQYGQEVLVQRDIDHLVLTMQPSQ